MKLWKDYMLSQPVVALVLLTLPELPDGINLIPLSYAFKFDLRNMS